MAVRMMAQNASIAMVKAKLDHSLQEGIKQFFVTSNILKKDN